MESMDSQVDYGHRTADFFDDDTSDEEPIASHDEPQAASTAELTAHRRSLTKKRNRKSSPTIERFVTQCEPKQSSVGPDHDGYQRLPTAAERDMQLDDLPSTPFNGSIDELLASQSERGYPLGNLGTVPARPLRQSINSARDGPLSQATTSANKIDQILGAHAIAHEITLQALMRDEDALDRSLQTFAPLRPGEHASLLPASTRALDPRSPREQTFATPQPTITKKVNVVPPPSINTSRLRPSIPGDIVRTPWPRSPEHVYSKYPRGSPSLPPPTPSIFESILTVSIRPSNRHNVAKVTTIVIPAPNDFRTARHSGTSGKEHHFRAIAFDDAEFFHALRRSYGELAGKRRFFSARCLSRIVVSGSATKAADAGYGWLVQPRSPRVLAHQGLSDSFSEVKLMQHYQKPSLGRSRYAFVHWAHRLAASPLPPPTRSSQYLSPPTSDEHERDLIRKRPQHEGIEFVISWSPKRITLALAMVVSLSVAAALLWIFLGKTTVAGHGAHGGFRDAGDRVESGVLVGICVLLVGLSGIAGWLGVSWLVM